MVPSRAAPAPSAGRPAPRTALVLLVGVAAISSGAILVRLAEGPALAVAFWRCALATALLAPFALRPLLRALAAASGRERALLLASGAFLALHFATWIRSLDFTTVAASVVLVNTTPLWVALLAPRLAADTVTRGTFAGVLLSVAGAAVIGFGDLRVSPRAWIGDVLALAGAFAAALYVLCGRRLRRHLDLWPYALACYGTAAAVLLVVALASGASLAGFSAPTWACLLGLALGPQLLGHTSYNYALRYASAALVSVAMLGEPIGAALLAWWLLGELPGWSTALGGALVLTGVAATAQAERRAARLALESPTGA